MIVSASPMMKPLSTGSEMKLARKPSRSSPAISASDPGDERERHGQGEERFVPPAARSPTAAADSAAVAAIGPVTRWRELPSAA